MRKEIGKYFLDVSKLVFGGVVLSTILKIEEFPKLYIFLFGISTTLILAAIGFYYIREK